MQQQPGNGNNFEMVGGRDGNFGIQAMDDS